MSCKHLNARFVLNNTAELALCPECKQQVSAAVILNNTLDHLQSLKAQMDDSIERIEAMFGR